MLNGSQTIAQALASIENTISHIRAALESSPGGTSLQLTPTNSYWISVGSAQIGHVVSLEQLNAPSSKWKVDREHWLRNPGVDFASAFDTQQDFTITPDLSCPGSTPCSPLQKQMDSLAKDWSSTFQMYALGRLKPADWSKTAPTLGTKLYAFAAAGTDPMRPRVVFDVNAQDTTKLDHIVWLTDDDSLSTFQHQVLTLQFVGNTLPTAGYYYTASR